MVHADGSELPRKELHEIAASLGLEPTSRVTKKACDLVVAADTSSQSGKTANARTYGIPLTDVHDFLKAQRGSTIQAVATS